MDRLLRTLTAKQFFEWQAYAALEPFGEVRDDYRAASIVTMLANINRDSKKRRKPYELKDFVLAFGDVGPKKKQTWQEQMQVMELFAAAFTKVGE